MTVEVVGLSIILDADAARAWLAPGPLPAALLTTYPADAMQGWRVSDAAKNSRIEPTPAMAEPA